MTANPAIASIDRDAELLARGDYLVRINNRKVLNGVLEAARVQPDQAADVLRQIDKFDKVGREGVLEERLAVRPTHQLGRADPAVDGSHLSDLGLLPGSRRC